MLHTGDLVTLHVNGVRYLEKAPLPYWVAAASMRVFGENAFAIHLPLALTVLALALLGYGWSRRAFNHRAALYTAIFTLTSTGVFLFTRIFIPDALLSLLLGITLFAALSALDPACKRPRLAAYTLWLALALAVLTKGLVALVFFFGPVLIFLIWTRQLFSVHRLRPFSGLLLFLAVAAPWHILAGQRNTGGAGGHGFFWFYFVNEHFLRFLGRRIPEDYNKLPTALYWALHFVWLFPWSLFAPAAVLLGWRARNAQLANRELNPKGDRLSRLDMLNRRDVPRWTTFPERTILLALLFSAVVLLFFAFSTNQEYYTFPAYLPLLMLLAASVAHAQQQPDSTMQRTLTASYAAFTVIGAAIAITLACGLWNSRRTPFIADIGSVLAHRNIGHYTLSMSHFFDLTGASFAALRLPAAIAAIAFATGPGVAWRFHASRKNFAAVLTSALTSTAFLIAAHVALVRFAPMLSSQNFADTIRHLEAEHRIQPGTEVTIYGDQAFGSSIPFYVHRRVLLVDGNTTSMQFGSTFPDAPPVFLTHEQLVAQWNTGPRKILFVPLERRDEVDHLLGARAILIQETSGKALFTDRPLEVNR